MKHEYKLGNDMRLIVEIDESTHRGIHLTQTVIDGHNTVLSTTVTCTCNSTGKSTTKNCPHEGNTCDCSDPNNPKVTCS